MTATTRDRARARAERDRILRSRRRFWRPGDLATTGSTTKHLLADLVSAGDLRRIRRGLYWRGDASPLGMSPPSVTNLVAELAPGPGVGPAGLYAANLLRLSTQVPRAAEIAVPGRAPTSPHGIRFAARQARSARVETGLTAIEVALLESLESWERVVELPAIEATALLVEMIRSGAVRPDALARASVTEPGAVRARLRRLLHAAGREDLVDAVPAPDPRTELARTRALAAAS